jgi:hypothetical protein
VKDARDKILARRAAFIAAALAGVGACKEPETPPQPCLSPVPTEPVPQPCLVPIAPTEPTDAGSESDAGNANTPLTEKPCLEVIAPSPPDAGAPPKPQPCLKIVPPSGSTRPPGPPRPQVCLTPVRPKDMK